MNPALLLDPRGARKKGNLLLFSNISQPSTNLLSTLSTLCLLPHTVPWRSSAYCTTYIMDDAIDFNMSDDSLYGANSPSSSLALQQWIDASHDHPQAFDQSTVFDLLPDTELTQPSPAQQAAQQSQTPPATPRFDPAALLNPKSAAKRPASTSEGSETSAGQVSLVERLHNVQERAASPAKRVKTTEEQQRRKKYSNGASFGGGSALDLTQNSGVPLPPPVDLTMSKSKTISPSERPSIHEKPPRAH
jgi:hypothetical protein